MFTHCGGKQRMPVVAAALQRIGVTAIAIVDFDFLRDLGDVERLVSTMGGNFGEILEPLKRIGAAMQSSNAKRTRAQVKTELEEVFDSAGDGPFDKKIRSALVEVLKTPSLWKGAKSHGIGMLRGDDYQRCVDVIQLLSKWGIWVLPNGEVEAYCKSVGKHGERWVGEVLSRKDLAADGELRELREFVSAAILGR
nr:hypothetical protein [Haloferula sp. BvORR071]